MAQGRERDVMRWDVRTALLRAQLERVEAAFAQAEHSPKPQQRERAANLARERDDLMRQLAERGPSPRAKMG